MATRVEWSGPEFVRAVDAAADLGVKSAAEVLAKEARSSMGRANASIVAVTNRYKPAPPGAPPNVQQGTLKRSITKSRRGPRRWVVGAGVIYGQFLEFGTSTMAARPWLRPALRVTQNSGRLNDTFARVTARELARRIVK